MNQLVVAYLILGLIIPMTFFYFLHFQNDYLLTLIYFSFTTTLAGLMIHLLKTLPIDPKVVLNHSELSIIVVVNTKNKVIYFNNPFLRLVPECSLLTNNTDIEVFTSILNNYVSKSEETKHMIEAIQESSANRVFGELCLEANVRKYYLVNIRPIEDQKRSRYRGRVITLTDITNFKIALEESAVSKERSRVIQDLHDSTGHTLSVLITQLEVCRLLCRKKPVEAEERLSNIIQMTRNGMDEIRRSISGLMPKNLESGNIIGVLDNLIQGFRSSGMKIDLIVDEQIEHCSLTYKNVIYRTCQEALTNSLRHGKATEACIILRFGNRSLKILIFDNGCGCEDLKTGLGLVGIKQRIEKLNGSIRFISNRYGQSGFNIRAELPLQLSGKRNEEFEEYTSKSGGER